MTVKDALKAELQVSVPDLLINKNLAANNILIDTDDDYDPDEDIYKPFDHDFLIDKMIISILAGLVSFPNISEGQFSVQYDREAMKARIDYLCSLRNIPNPLRPKVRGISPW
jgi:hypothetical protein